jgi:hypothetical protein
MAACVSQERRLSGKIGFPAIYIYIYLKPIQVDDRWDPFKLYRNLTRQDFMKNRDKLIALNLHPKIHDILDLTIAHRTWSNEAEQISRRPQRTLKRQNPAGTLKSSQSKLKSKAHRVAKSAKDMVLGVAPTTSPTPRKGCPTCQDGRCERVIYVDEQDLEIIKSLEGRIFTEAPPGEELLPLDKVCIATKKCYTAI